MSRMHRLRRRAGQSVVVHDRARSLAARRLDEPLEAADAAWLADHLAGCAACRSVAAAYEADRLLLRGLRDQQPEPPRDLWARTAAAIERESAAHGGPHRTTGGGRRGPALGFLAGVAVVAVVIGATVLVGRVPERPTECGDRAAGDAPTGRRGAVVDDARSDPDRGRGRLRRLGRHRGGRQVRLQRHEGQRGLPGRAPAGLRARQGPVLQAGRHADPAEVDLEITGPQRCGRRRDQRGRR